MHAWWNVIGNCVGIGVMVECSLVMVEVKVDC